MTSEQKESTLTDCNKLEVFQLKKITGETVPNHRPVPTIDLEHSMNKPDAVRTKYRTK